MVNPYATNETAPELWFEQINYAAVCIGGIAYGMHILIYFMTTYYLIIERKRSNWKWLLFVFLLFSLGTLNIVFNMHFNEQAWIDDRNYPGGPLAYLLEQQSVPIQTAGNAESILISFMADALLIYRVHILYRLWWILIIPILLWLATTVFGVLFVIQAALPLSSLTSNSTLQFSLPYFAMSMSLNILLTLLLVSRLLYMRHKMTAALGKQHAQTYGTVATMLLESAAPYALISFIFIILYGIGNVAAILLIPLLVQAECIAPMLIVLRVARGRAWTSEIISEAQLSKLRFGSTQAGSNRMRGSKETYTVGSSTIPHFTTKSKTRVGSEEGLDEEEMGFTLGPVGSSSERV
ncbi:hypothetical protein M422DRAFT_30489 [Sphaerobolus stellatus SS14]|uniref:Uncharacterized protein n=1 Tax=Sphaerobolus stellatus (strain SS14) TaxID=990650 RepID=A0A0C9VQ21_SPHS4|nr:hypothetical protein M422DRAFT_30489 [Sphaerobolus stellatus SS14]